MADDQTDQQMLPTEDGLKDKFLSDRAQSLRPDDGWIKALAQPQTAMGRSIDIMAPDSPQPSTQSATPPTSPDGPQLAPTGAEGLPADFVGLNDAYKSIGSKALTIAKAVGSDVTRGVVGAPKQVVGGSLDFVNNMFRFADDVVKKAEDAGLPNVYFRMFDKDGQWSPSMMSAEAFRQAQADGKDDVFQIPTTDKPDTVTGQIVRTATTFMLGRGNIASGGGIAANAAADFASGALLDPKQERLSNIVDSVAPNFVTDWLKAKPEDEGSMLGRLKSGMEYAGLGLAFEGAKRALQATKQTVGPQLQAAGQQGSFEDQVAALERPSDFEGAKLTGAGQGPSVAGATETGAVKPSVSVPQVAAPPRDFLNLGDPLRPAVEIPDSPALRDMADKFLSGESGENPVKINLSRVDGEDGIKDILARVSSTIPKEGPVTWDETNALATSLGITPQQLLDNYKGTGLTAAELRSANLITRSGAEQLYSYARAAIDPTTATPEAKAMAVKAFLTQRAMQQYFENARGEAGRTLNILKQMSQPRHDYASAIDTIVRGAQEADMDSVFAKITSLGEPGAPGTAEKVAALVGQSANMSAKDVLTYGWYNLLLSNPRTLVKKVASDTFNATWNLVNHYAAEKLGSGDIQPGETAQYLYGYIGSLKDGMRAGGKALQAGESQFWRDYQSSIRPTNLLGESVSEPLSSTDQIGSLASLLKSAAPTSWIGAVDDAATVTNYRASLRMLAYRDASKKGLTGPALDAAMEDQLRSPKSWMHTQAVSDALRSTFKSDLDGKIASSMQSISDLSVPLAHSEMELPVGKIIMPFVKIPANIAKWSYRNSALAAVFPTEAVQAELASGGATRDLAIARMGLGSIAMLSMADLALSNQITGGGPKEPEMQRAWREAGNEPYSFRIGGKWYGYNFLEPFGMPMAAMADSVGVMRFAKDDDRENIAASIMFGMGEAMLSKTYLMGVSNLFEAMNDPEHKGDRYIRHLGASIVPQGVSAIQHATDPWVRAHYSYLDDVWGRIPYLSQGLPPARTLWGAPIPQKDAWLPLIGPTQLGNIISPIQVGPTDAEPISKWIWDNRRFFPRGDENRLGLPKPSQVQVFSGGNGVSARIELDPFQHDRLQVLGGNELKDPSTHLGAKDMLNALVENKLSGSVQDQWNRASTEEKTVVVRKIVNDFRGAAKKQLLVEYPDLRATVQSALQMRANDLSKPSIPAQ